MVDEYLLLHDDCNTLIARIGGTMFIITVFILKILIGRNNLILEDSST